MSSPGQRRGVCGHVMAVFDKHSHFARCRDKLKGDNPCVNKKPCSFCDVLMPEQKLQISTPSYQKKKEKQEQKSVTADKSAENVSETLVDPSLVSVVGVVSTGTKAMKSPPKSTKDKQKKKHSTPVKKSSSTDRGIRSFMGWTHIPDMDTSSSSADDNPFQAPKQ